MSDQILICEGLRKSYGRKHVLADCSFSVARGELVGLVGENGSGKSTLLRCILGYTHRTAGAITLNGRIGYSPQERYLNGSYTVDEHVELISAIYSREAPLDPAYCNGLMDRLKLGDYRGTLIRHLSEGTRQKLVFLTSIVHGPSLLLMDEPYDGLDWNMYLTFWDIVQELRNDGTGILLVSHLLFDRSKFDRLYTLAAGELSSHDS